MNLDSESIQRHIPYYLVAEDRRLLIKELRAISSGGKAGYFLSARDNSFKQDMLQGDGWRGFELLQFYTGERRSVKGLVLSNSCDIDPDNPRDLPARVVFAPLVKLSAYQAQLARHRVTARRIEDKIAAVRAQRITNIFYLPAEGPLKEEYVAPLDHVYSMPLAAFAANSDKKKLFTLSNTGLYMLVFKLSAHFCRLQEKVNRKP